MCVCCAVIWQATAGDADKAARGAEDAAKVNNYTHAFVVQFAVWHPHSVPTTHSSHQRALDAAEDAKTKAGDAATAVAEVTVRIDNGE